MLLYVVLKQRPISPLGPNPLHVLKGDRNHKEEVNTDLNNTKGKVTKRGRRRSRLQQPQFGVAATGRNFHIQKRVLKDTTVKST